ncbi:hypothetical protein ACH4CE_11550 [Streptomyces gelaticus]|uniref:hypothetical protein n=1 Tax=Streptomyces gelaticus TaxID=285446 RepID=UPI0037BAB46A
MPSAALGLVYRWSDHTLNPTGEARAVLRRVLKDPGLSGRIVSVRPVRGARPLGRRQLHLRDPRRGSTAPLYRSATSSPNAEPAEGESGLLVERGRGLHIVHELTQGQWGFPVADCGNKAAWVVLAAASGSMTTRGSQT